MRFDTYTFLARVCPMLVLIFPAMLAVFAWFPDDGTLPTALGGLGMTVAVSFFVAQIGRDSGFQLQAQLWESWGGSPTTQLLRHSGNPNQHLLERYHQKLSALLNKSFPTKQEELEAPSQADQIYEASAAILRQRTRDSKGYPLVFKELVNYGFRRNLYGCRGAGILLSAVSTVDCAVSASFHSDPNDWLLCSISAALLAFWLLRVNSEWVRIPAFAYARALLETTEQL